MQKELFIGADIGTSNIKVAAYDCGAQKVCEASREYGTVFIGRDCAEQDAADWWNGFCDALKEVTASAGCKIRTISISSHVPALIPISKDGSVLIRPLIWMDNRSSEQCERIQRECGEELLKNNPSRLQPYHFLSKLVWFYQTHPELYQKTWKFLQPKDYINYMLTGICATDTSASGLNHLYDLCKNSYSKKLADLLHIEMEKLPEVRRTADAVGKVQPEIAAALGISEETVVLCGGVDTTLAAWGSGISKKGDVTISTGTGGNIVLCTDHPLKNPHLFVMPYLTEGLYLETAVHVNVGGVLKWYKNCFGKEYEETAKRKKEDVYNVISEEAAKSLAGCGGLMMLPFIGGELAPVFDPYTKGVFFGIGPNVAKKDFARAAMEGVCFALRQSLELIVEESGNKVEQITVSGGLSKSPFWMQMLADIAGLPIKVNANTLEAPFGNALLGIEKCGKTAQIKKQEAAVYWPDEENRKLYEKYYRTFLKLYPCLKNQFRLLENRQEGNA